ncbi:uncharacterized protein ATC70_011723 [Mucor velutinosus]|uniref:Uncharacterized protein n=1 Tax=Mucor velutinosus TaxID=708070 RepID=A0AAN7DIU3_9FUNG|nr:hypothetical protein ATC70_011723 [Mucor velutinosus]
MNMAAVTQQEAELHSHDVLYMIPSTKYQFERDGEKTLLQDYMGDDMPANTNQINGNDMLSSSPPALTQFLGKHVPVQLYDNPPPALSITNVPSSTRSTGRSRSLSTKKSSLRKSFFHKVKSFFLYSNKS